MTSAGLSHWSELSAKRPGNSSEDRIQLEPLRKASSVLEELPRKAWTTEPIFTPGGLASGCMAYKRQQITETLL